MHHPAWFLYGENTRGQIDGNFFKFAVSRIPWYAQKICQFSNTDLIRHKILIIRLDTGDHGNTKRCLLNGNVYLAETKPFAWLTTEDEGDSFF